MHILSFLWMCSVMALLGSAADLEEHGPYQIPIVEARLCVISINSDRDFRLDLVRLNPKRIINIFLGMTKYDNESQIVATGLGDNVAIVSRDKMDLRVSQRNYISVYRKDNVLAVYRPGQIKPHLVYVYKGNEKIDFVDFEIILNTGPRGRSFMGYPILSDQGTGVGSMAEPHGEIIEKELHSIRREVYRRLGILDAYFKKLQIQQLPLATLKTIKEVVDRNLSAQISLLNYYGITMKQKYQVYFDTVFKKKRAEIVARIKSLSK